MTPQQFADLIEYVENAWPGSAKWAEKAETQFHRFSSHKLESCKRAVDGFYAQGRSRAPHLSEIFSIIKLAGSTEPVYLHKCDFIGHQKPSQVFRLTPGKGPGLRLCLVDTKVCMLEQACHCELCLRDASYAPVGPAQPARVR